MPRGRLQRTVLEGTVVPEPHTRDHCGSLFVSLWGYTCSEPLSPKLRASRALYTDPHLPVAAAIPPGRAFTGGGAVGSCLLLVLSG